jgi:uncharacterized protein YpuA (DUF1002 family)
LNRIKGLLDKVGLTDRLVTRLSDIDSAVVKPIDFTHSHQQLETLRQVTWNYLDEALASKIVKKPIEFS